MSAKPFKNKYLSVSRLKRFDQCPLSFKLHYIDKLRGVAGDPLLFGSLLHKVLERLYLWIIEEEFQGRIDEQRAVDLYREEWPASGLAGFEFYQEGLNIVKAYVRENAMVDHRNILSVEQEFHLQVGEFEVMGFIDRIDRVDEETVEVIDYKSNRLIFTRDDVDTELQLTIYHMAAQKLWPWAKNIRLSFHLLRHGMKMVTERTDEQLDNAKEYVISVGKQTESATDFSARLNTNCQYCDHRQNCPVYIEAVDGKAEIVKSSPKDLASVAREREQVANLAKILYSRKAELEKILKAQLKTQDTLELAGMVYRFSHTKQIVYPVESTLKVLKEHAGVEDEAARDLLLVVDKKKIDAFVKKVGKGMERAQLRLLKTRLEAVADISLSPRFYSKASK